MHILGIKKVEALDKEIADEMIDTVYAYQKKRPELLILKFSVPFPFNPENLFIITAKYLILILKYSDGCFRVIAFYLH
jgi:hypothetical protein